jgi:excisionase family DNA binding protein
MLRPAAAAEYLGVSPSTLQRWRTQTGLGPRFLRIGCQIMYRQEDLDEYIADQVEEPRNADE